MPTILTFADALLQADSLSGAECDAGKRLLVGNGFSMACHGEFGYTALYTKVREMGLSKQLQEIFEKFGQTNFEAVLKLLDQAAWVSEHYKMVATDASLDMRSDYEMLKKNLAEAICAVHPTHSAIIPKRKYTSCYNFISNFDDIYSINYDLLLYWTSLAMEPFAFKDGFSKDKDTDGNDCEFMNELSSTGKHIYFLHGALHLYHDGADVRKRVWKNSGVHLITQIHDALEKKQYPLVVAEGDSDDKLIQIQESSYLSNSFRKFKGFGGHLFLFGCSLSDSDQHILDAIVKNIRLRHLWIGIRGGFENGKNKHFLQKAEEAIARRQGIVNSYKKMGKKNGDLTVHYYDSDSANVWSE